MHCRSLLVGRPVGQYSKHRYSFADADADFIVSSESNITPRLRIMWNQEQWMKELGGCDIEELNKSTH